MFIKRLLQLNLICSALLAATFIFIPRTILSLYGIVGGDQLYVIARYFGSTHVAFAVLLWIALRENQPTFLRWVVISFFAGDSAGTIVLLIAQLQGLMGSSGWFLVGLSFLLALGYGYGTFNKLPKS